MTPYGSSGRGFNLSVAPEASGGIAAAAVAAPFLASAFNTPSPPAQAPAAPAAMYAPEPPPPEPAPPAPAQPTYAYNPPPPEPAPEQPAGAFIPNLPIEQALPEQQAALNESLAGSWNIRPANKGLENSSMLEVFTPEPAPAPVNAVGVGNIPIWDIFSFNIPTWNMIGGMPTNTPPPPPPPAPEPVTWSNNGSEYTDNISYSFYQ